MPEYHWLILTAKFWEFDRHKSFWAISRMRRSLGLLEIFGGKLLQDCGSLDRIMTTRILFIWVEKFWGRLFAGLKLIDELLKAVLDGLRGVTQVMDDLEHK